MTLLLTQKICSLFLIVVAGALIVRMKLVRPEDSRILSLLVLYFVFPCAILNSFQVECTPQVRQGLVLGGLASLVIPCIMIPSSWLLGKIFRFTSVEKASTLYCNCANLVIPLVTAVLGKEWLIYSLSFVAVQTILMWSHLRLLIEENGRFDWKKIALNINFLMILAGLAMFFIGIRLPAPIAMAVDSIADMIGPMSMLITGMLIGHMQLQRILFYKRVWLITFFRLVFWPVLICLGLHFSGLAALAPSGREILLVTLIAAITPSATTVVQMSQVYHNDHVYANAINVVTTLSCIVTMPLVVWLYQILGQ